MSASVSVRTPWFSLVTLGLAAFAIVSAEFLPVGVLPQIARDTQVPLSLTSAIVLVPGLTAGIAAPLIILGARRIDRRALLVAVVVILMISDVGTWLSSGFEVLLVCRFLLGLCLGGFWAVGPSFGAKLAPTRPGIATSVVLGGISAGTVLGLPVGELLEGTVGWRFSFALGALLAVAVGVLLLVVVHGGSAANEVKLADLVGVVRNRASRIALTAAAIAFMSQLVGSTFIGALLGRIPGVTSTQVTVLLFVYGALGLAGNLIAPRIPISAPRLFLTASALMVIVFGLIAFSMQSLWIITAALVMWGLLWGAIPLLGQVWTVSTVPSAPEAGSALLVTVSQTSIALGSLISGIALEVGGLRAVYIAGAVLFAVAATLLAVLLPKVAGPAVQQPVDA